MESPLDVHGTTIRRKRHESVTSIVMGVAETKKVLSDNL